MSKKVTTINLQGKEYAQVATRLKEFREANTHGSIETKPTILEDGSVMFSTTIIKDLSDEYSARSTGTALGKMKGQKDFEKLETISVGRALALLGYAASGEIASGEEMEEFLKFQEEKKTAVLDMIKTLEACKTVDELKEKFLSSGMLAEPEVIATKNKVYKALTSVILPPKEPKADEPKESNVKKRSSKKLPKVEEGEVSEDQLPPELK